MPIERDAHCPPVPDSHFQEMEQMESIWESLPDEHRVALALNFVETIMNHEYRPYFLHLFSQKYPLRTEELESAYPTIEITELDLRRTHLDDEELALLTADDREKMAEIMRSHYIHDLFWPELRYLVQTFVKKDNL